MDEKPCLLIVSSSNTKPKSLIKLITKSTNINEIDEHHILHPWTIDTKYYTAEINIIGINEHYQRTDEFNSNVEALIIHMDTNKDTGLDDLAIWKCLEIDCQPEIKLLITNYCTNDTKITKTKAIEWCLKYGYELIELYPNLSENNNCNDDIIEEKYGVERVIEALQAHMWPNLIMKDETNNITTTQDSIKTQSNINDNSTDEVADDFTELFSQLSTMKECLQSLSMNQRKQCAEQMVTAFWKAIGGDEEEIADI